MDSIASTVIGKSQGGIPSTVIGKDQGGGKAKLGKHRKKEAKKAKRHSSSEARKLRKSRRNAATTIDIEAQLPQVKTFSDDLEESARRQIIFLEQVALVFSRVANHIYDRVITFIFGITFFHCRPYEYRAMFVFGIQLLTSDATQMLLLKLLQIQYGINNFIFLLAMASSFSFIVACFKIMRTIPCPTLASMVSNTAIICIFVLVSLMSYTLFEIHNAFMLWRNILVFCSGVLTASVIARLYIDRNMRKNPLSPITHYLIFGIIGAGSAIVTVVGIKQVTVTDGIVALCLDPLASAICYYVFPLRRIVIQEYFRVYFLLFVLWWWYFQEGMISYSWTPSAPRGVIYILSARLLLHLRSAYLKWYFARMESAYGVPPPRETWTVLFEGSLETPPIKYRFEPSQNAKDQSLHEPALFRLECIWNSGLMDDVMHALGYQGTIDLYTQSDALYTAWIAASVSYAIEGNTVGFGFLPPVLGFAAGDVKGITADDFGPILLHVTSFRVFIVVFVFLLYVLARYLTPYAASLRLYDVGSSPHYWKYAPPLLMVPAFFTDWLFLNPMITDTQIFLASSIACFVVYYRDTLWERQWRSHLVNLLMDLNYSQPTCLRLIQKRQLYDTLKNCHIEDFANLLLNTCVSHGNNLKDDRNVHDETTRVWAPTPAAAAAWKLCKSLVMRAERKKKEINRKKIREKAAVVHGMSNIIIHCIDTAVEVSGGLITMEELEYVEEDSGVFELDYLWDCT